MSESNKIFRELAQMENETEEEFSVRIKNEERNGYYFCEERMYGDPPVKEVLLKNKSYV